MSLKYENTDPKVGKGNDPHKEERKSLLSQPDPKAAKERDVLNALSAKYAHKLPPSSLNSKSLQELGGSGQTISRDYTGSKEEKEIAALKLLVKKYEGSSFQVFSSGENSIPGQEGGLFDVANFDFANPNDGNSDVLQDFDFDSFLHQDGDNDDNFNSGTSLFDDLPTIPPKPTHVQEFKVGSSHTESSVQKEARTGSSHFQPFHPPAWAPAWAPPLPKPSSYQAPDNLSTQPKVKPTRNDRFDKSQRPTKKRRVYFGQESTPESHNGSEHIKQPHQYHIPSISGLLRSAMVADDEEEDEDENVLREHISDIRSSLFGLEKSPTYSAEELAGEADLPGRVRHTKRKNSGGVNPSASVEVRASNSDSNDGRLPTSASQLKLPQFLRPGGPASGSSQYYQLFNMLSKLQEDNKSLRLHISSSQALVWKTLHRVQCGIKSSSTTYSDVPISYGKRGHSHLQGQHFAGDVELFIARQRGRVSFVVFQKYNCCGHKSKSCQKHEIETKRQGPSVIASTGEEVQVVSQTLSETLEWITERCDHGDGYYPSFEVGCVVKAPYFWYYHNREELREAASSLTQEQQAEFKLFQEYLSQNMGKEYEEVDNMLSTRKITGRYFDYLFNPETILFDSNANAAFVEETWPENSFSQFRLCDDEYQVMNHTLQTKAWHWGFDGVFQKRTESLPLKFATEDSGDEYLLLDEEIDIDSLRTYPLKYAKPGVESALREKGEKFWSCRYQNYVAYHGSDYRSEEINTDTRYMVDLATFYKMHPEKRPSMRLIDQLGPEVMARQKPPDGDFLLLLPGKVHGFNMQEKRWVDLQAEHIRKVEWNKEAFTSLVADDDTKELITALVTNQLAAERATDLMRGKGTGLIILLHGGPGTGKTLTAESVAEIAEKPLYRVTCGDIPTAPDAVEKYLETVLLLGKTWGCVVLLDEADVFLEQRTLQDLQRNALVSVFLRVLEYYDGILILTSNRVGTFDEAFKSRIQLALHYENLNKDQRRQIWKIFIKRLEGFEKEESTDSAELIDTEDLRDHLDELSGHNMNGRQIRNAVTTARQLAVHKQEKMSFKHLNHVIKVAQKFERYLLMVREGVGDDQIMREDGIR